MAEIAFEHVEKFYPNGFHAITDLNLTISDGEFLVLVGPSGCGKSTALRLVAGLEEISDGILRIGDRVVNNLHSKDRDIAMVFQSYALYPHMSVKDNIGFALKLGKIPKPEIKQRVENAARVLELTDYLDRKPGQLSGGQRQRVAMGRAIVRQPKAFLMDEPLSNLDAKLRVQMRAEINSLQHQLGVTTLYVTHDQVEAMTMGHRVAVIKGGVLQQVGTPKSLYTNPDNLFVAGFIGSPSMNLFESTLDCGADGAEVTVGSQSIGLDNAVMDARTRLSQYDGRKLVVGIRPDDLEDSTIASDAPADRRLRATAEIIEDLGSEVMIHFSTDAPRAVTDVQEVAEGARKAGASRLVGRFSPRSKVRIADEIEISVDSSRFHFFDRETGLAVRD